jgi:hypothetical protein
MIIIFKETEVKVQNLTRLQYKLLEEKNSYTYFK